MKTKEEIMKNNKSKTWEELIEKTFNETKKDFGEWLSPTEQMDFWATFGQKIYGIYKKLL